MCLFLTAMPMDSIVVSAPGKVILHGEHAVVYKRRAIAASLNLRTFLKLDYKDNDKVEICLPDINLQCSWSTKELKNKFKFPFCDPKQPAALTEETLAALQQFLQLDSGAITDTHSLALVSFLYMFGSIAATEQSVPSVRVRLVSSLPPGAGLGSSAAYSACLAASLLRYRHLVSEPSTAAGANPNIGGWAAADLTLINSWAFQSEKIIHGTPSGIDNSISTYGGALNFQAGQITPLSKVPELRILLINTKVPRSTKVLVANVRQKYEKYPEVIDFVLDAIEAISEKCETLLTSVTDRLAQQHYDILNDLVEMNQSLLRLLGVSHPSLEQVCQLCSSHGLHCKLTGAGGGGCAVTLISPETTEAQIGGVQQGAGDLGYDCWETSIGGPGVVQHLTLDDTFIVPPTFITADN